jgi:DNA anti-recombination protein RmuC
VTGLEQAAIVLGVLIALLTAIGLIAKGLRAVWRTLRRANQYFDEVNGDRERGIPSMAERVRTIEQDLRAHTENHNPPMSANRGRPVRTR